MNHLSSVIEQPMPIMIPQTLHRTFIKPMEHVEYDWRKLNIEDVITEDETPVDGIAADKQHRFLVQTLNNPNLPPPLGKEPFVAGTNIGLFSPQLSQPLVPDAFLSLKVKLPEDLWENRHRAYFVDVYGKPPEVVVEVVSNRKGGEDNKKLREYALVGVLYYIIYDPKKRLSKKVVRCYELQGKSYVEMASNWFIKVNLGVTLWKGVYEGREDTWLRWCDQSGQILLTGDEVAEQERQQKIIAEQRAEQSELQTRYERQQKIVAEQRTEQEHQRAEQECLAKEQERFAKERLAAKLRELGIDPDTL